MANFLTFVQSYSELFALMTVSVYMCLFSGLILIIIEFFSLSKGVLGTTGVVLVLASIVIRMLSNGSFAVLFAMLSLIAAVIFISYIIMLLSQKRKWLLHSLTLMLEGSVSNSAGYNYIKNLTGVATTDINPTGHIAIGEINFFVSAPEFIEKGSVVRVVEADGEKIVVKQSIDGQTVDYRNSRSQFKR